ncbi:MAG TPA: mannose-6-phosphate isomerase [Planctomycetaceae bacterium]|nr:mannose-6-phosphate isomerase [Planctomycetaceae bacterium]
MKRTVWGGRRLGDLLGKPIGPENDYAESWEIVDHGESNSKIIGGPWGGRTLRDVICDRNASVLGSYAGIESFPLLLKYLDCNRVLSVQVHPDDHYAMQMPQPDLGKTEAWYIVDAAPGSKVYAGLRSGVDRKSLQQAIAAGCTEDVLHVFEPRPGQCIFIPAGTVHALGGGLVVAEIQQSSDTTFRLFDWNRVGDDGWPRQLHIEQALDVTNYSIGPIKPQTPQADADGMETLVRCDKFVLKQAILGSTLQSKTVSIGNLNSPVIMTVVKGAATLDFDDGWRCDAPIGQSFLIPASTPTIELSSASDAVLLLAYLP